MTSADFLKSIESKGFTICELASGKLRITSPAKITYLMSPVESVKFGTWFNESTLLTESICAG
jgi:hypothetical protein